MAWNKLIDELNTQGTLSHFTEDQTQATVAILATVMHADDRVSTLEHHEFEALLAKLPFFESKAQTAAQVEAGIAKAKAAGGPDGFKAIIDAVAVHIDDAADRREVFRLAATMAYADHRLDDRESEVLDWIAAAFSIDDAADLLAKIG